MLDPVRVEILHAARNLGEPLSSQFPFDDRGGVVIVEPVSQGAADAQLHAHAKVLGVVSGNDAVEADNERVSQLNHNAELLGEAGYELGSFRGRIALQWNALERDVFARVSGLVHLSPAAARKGHLVDLVELDFELLEQLRLLDVGRLLRRLARHDLPQALDVGFDVVNARLHRGDGEGELRAELGVGDVRGGGDGSGRGFVVGEDEDGVVLGLTGVYEAGYLLLDGLLHLVLLRLEEASEVPVASEVVREAQVVERLDNVVVQGREFGSVLVEKPAPPQPSLVPEGLDDL
mmetsp:Transcript_1247/g.3754  ORF Transcript_1247/g.3754 Transcript_1247/m.3754 type:complete len:291 (-) Transcript_1247:1423-2295(-)